MNQIVISVDKFQTRAALLEDGKLSELYIEREDEKKVNGSIYKGKVANVLPGMESAFLDIGFEKNAFLYVKDLREFEERYLNGIENSERAIEDILKVGDEVVVQILKDPRGSKGARVTTHYTIPGKYLVLMPNNDYVAISQKIKDPAERERLEKVMNDIKPGSMGVILRTAAEGKSELHLEREVEYLAKKWNEIESKVISSKPGQTLYSDNELTMTVVRDIFSSSVDELIIDDEEKYWEILDYVSAFSESSLKTKIKLYDGDAPIFDTYGIKSQIDDALESEVKLECGGSIVVEKTEALVSIDINTGSNTGKNTGSMVLSETVLQTNLEAAKEIPRQLRLRNLSGIIIIDFIDMKTEEDKQKVVAELEKHLGKDRIKNNIIHFTDLGLVEMTRKRVGKSLSRYYQTDCVVCNGTGKVKSKEVIALELITEIKNLALDKDISVIKVMMPKELSIFFREMYKEFVEVYLKTKNKKLELETGFVKDKENYEITLKV